MVKNIALSILFTITLLHGNYLLQKGEKLLFGFKTKSGKLVTIALGPKKSYLVYRFGKKGHIEFEYPKDKKNAFPKFIYSHISRGGGVMNAGIDLSYLRFKNKGYLYVIYDEYSALDNQEDIGIKVIKKEKVLANIKGVLKSKKGSLLNFDDLIENGVPIKKDEKEFDF